MGTMTRATVMGMGVVSGVRCSMHRCGIERKAAASWLRSVTSPALATALVASWLRSVTSPALATALAIWLRSVTSPALATALVGGRNGGRVASPALATALVGGRNGGRVAGAAAAPKATAVGARECGWCSDGAGGGARGCMAGGMGSNKEGGEKALHWAAWSASCWLADGRAL